MPPEPKIEWTKVTWYSKTLAILLFVILVSGAFCFGVWYQKQRAINFSLSIQQTSSVPVITYKHGFYGDIPSTWSTYENDKASGEVPAQTLQDLTSPATLAYSFSPTGITFGDGAFGQVDFYYLTNAAANALISLATQDKDQITT